MANLSDFMTLLQQKTMPAVDTAKDIYNRIKSSNYGQLATTTQQLMQEPAELLANQIKRSWTPSPELELATKALMAQQNPVTLDKYISAFQPEALSLAMGFTTPAPQVKTALNMIKPLATEAKGVTAYHGGNIKRDVLDFTKAGSKEQGFGAKSGIWFTKSKSTAKGYGKEVMETKLDLQNPKVIDAKGKMYGDMRDVIDEQVPLAKKQGYDGVIIKNLSDEKNWGQYKPTDHYVVFDKKSITQQPLPPLKAEATKYKSAEEFAKKTYYHATTPQNADSILKSGFKTVKGDLTSKVSADIPDGVFLYRGDNMIYGSDGLNNAREFGKNFPQSKIVATEVNGKVLRTLKSPSEITADLVKTAQSKGYVGISGEELGVPYTFVFDKNAVKPISEVSNYKNVTDFYTQAKGGVK